MFPTLDNTINLRLVETRMFGSGVVYLRYRRAGMPRQIKVHGLAEIVERAGRFGQKEYLAINPTVSRRFGSEAGENYQGGNFAWKKIVWIEERGQ